MKSLYKIAFLFVLSVFLYSCRCEYHIKRVKAKCGYNSDTIVRVDTVITKDVSTDTVFKYYTKDTVVIKEGKLTVKYFYNSHDSTVFLQGKCDADTVIRKVPVIVNKYKTSWYESKSLWWLLFFVAAILIVRAIFK